MSGHLLSKEERERFAAWCEAEARTNDGINEQAKKLGPVGEGLIKRNRISSSALIIVATMLRSIEDCFL